jgi:hypothetical protein
MKKRKERVRRNNKNRKEREIKYVNKRKGENKTSSSEKLIMIMSV